MAWAGTVTDHGTANRCNSSSTPISVGPFTPAADSLLIAVVQSANSVTASHLSGQDSGTAWALVGSLSTTHNRSCCLFAAHPGGSPSSGSVTLDSGTVWTEHFAVLEITDVYVDGTIAQSFGTMVFDGDNYNVGDVTITLGSFSNSEGLTLAVGYASGSGFTWEGTYTESDDAAGCNATNTEVAYYGGEDTSVVITGGHDWSYWTMAAVEVVGISAAAPPPVLRPNSRYLQNFLAR